MSFQQELRLMIKLCDTKSLRWKEKEIKILKSLGKAEEQTEL